MTTTGEVETREQHLEWCKQRALQHCDAGNPDEAMASFLSDMSKHSETQGHIALPLMVQMRLGGMLNSAFEMRKFILGFN